ncbi:MAG: flippase [Chloroflexi bacterium]|nr:flippase [Chloroflexota bacterium]
MSTKVSVAKNAVILMGTQMTTWVMSLLLTIFLPRYLGPAAVGQYHFSNSIWAILAILASLGMDTYLTKEAARRPENVGGMVWNSALLRILFYLLCVGGLALYLEAFKYPVETRMVAYVIGISSLIWMLISVIQSVLIGFESMKYVSLGNIAGRIVGTVVSITLLLLGQKIVVIASVNILSALITLAIEFIFLKRIVAIPVHINLQEMWHLVKGGLPYLLSGVFLVLYLQFDFVIISLLVDDKTVGWYGAADTLFGTLLFVPTVLMTAVFPVLSRMYVNDKEGLPRVTRKSFDLLVILGIPIGLGVIAAANSTVLLLFGAQFTQSGPVLSLFGVVVILTYLTTFLGQFLISVDRQNQWTIVMAVATAVTLLLDLWLVPWCAQTFSNGALGGAISFIVTEGGMLVAGLLMMPKGILGRANLWLALRAILSGLVMLASIWWIRSLPILNIYVFILILVVGALVYLLMGWILRLITPEDGAIFKNLVAGILSKFKSRRTPDENQSF